MGIPHLSVNLCLWNESCNRVHDHDIHSTGTNHGLCDLQSLLSVIRLRNIKIINIYANIPGINRIQCMLRVNKARNTAPFLYFCHHMERNRGLTGRLRTVYLDNPSLGDTAQSQCNIQTDRTCGNRFYIHIHTGFPQLHHRTLAIGFFNLCEGRIQGL